MKEEISKETLTNMLINLANAFTEERKKTEPYKEMFEEGSTYTGLFRHLEIKMTDHVLDACDVLKEKHGIKVTNDQYHVLLALPLLVQMAERNAVDNEGLPCSVDKAHFILSEQFKALSE